MVEAKAHLDELRSSCGAIEAGGRTHIARTLSATKERLGVAADRDWLDGFYQYANRVAVLGLLNQSGVPARLLNIYFTGDNFPDPPRSCPSDAGGWAATLESLKAHIGLPSGHALEGRMHNMFLPVCPAEQPRGNSSHRSRPRKAAVAVMHRVNEPLSIEQVDLDSLARNEVLIRTAFGGVCQSDPHYMVGHYPRGSPCVLGHEPSGVVGMIPTSMRVEISGAEILGEKRIWGCAMGPNGFRLHQANEAAAVARRARRGHRRLHDIS